MQSFLQLKNKLKDKLNLSSRQGGEHAPLPTRTVKSENKKIVIVLAVAVLLLAACLLYSRPLALSQLYPTLTLDKCTEIRGYYEVGTQTNPQEFSLLFTDLK